MKLISIITINYNNASALEKTILSVIAYTDIVLTEYIVIDGGSTDGSVEIINKYSNNIDKWCSEPDAGIYDAMNKGIEKTNGKYLWFINSGDEIADLQSFQYVAEACSQEKFGLIYGDLLLDNGRQTTLYKQTDYVDFAFMIGKTLNHQSFLLKAQYFYSLKFDLNFKITADWVHLFHTLRNEEVSQYKINYPIVKYDTTGFSSTNDSNRLIERHTFLSSIYTTWELESLQTLSRLRSRKYYALLKKSLGSKRRGAIISTLLKLLYLR